MAWVLWLFLFLAVFIIAAIKLYAVLTCGRFQITGRFPGRVVLITGCTSGIGKVAAREFAKAGAKVYMACRNELEAEKVAVDIRATSGSSQVYVLACDLSNLRSVRECANTFLATGDALHILVNNAGLARSTNKRLTEDKLEETMASNHFGHFLLTNLLLDKLKSSAPSRIVVLSSIMHRFGDLDLTDPSYENRCYPGPGQAYSDSKLANILFSRELARQLAGTGVTSNAVHPGVVKTDIYRSVPLYLQPFLNFLYIYFKTADEGAQSILYAALSPKLNHVSGHYFWDNKPASMSLKALDDNLAAQLWKVSRKLTGLE